MFRQLVLSRWWVGAFFVLLLLGGCTFPLCFVGLFSLSSISIFCLVLQFSEDLRIRPLCDPLDGTIIFSLERCRWEYGSDDGSVCARYEA